MSTGLLVVGVGRSGTSVATRLASELGLRLPSQDDLMPANNGNPEGYWESQSLADFNDGLLVQLKGSWWQPPPEMTGERLALLADSQAQATKLFEGTFGQTDGWIWKDPRLAILLPFWNAILGRPAVLFPIRQPQAVARSIARRDGLTYEQGLAIWERHMRLALPALQGHRTAVVAYETLLSNPGQWQKELFDFCLAAGLPVGAHTGAVQTPIVEPASAAEGALSAEQSALWECIVERKGFHESFPTLGLPEETPAVRRVMQGSLAPQWMPAQVVWLRGKTIDLEHHLRDTREDLEQRLTDTDEELNRHKAALAEKDDQLNQQRLALAEQERERHRLTVQIAALEQSVRDLGWEAEETKALLAADRAKMDYLYWENEAIKGSRGWRLVMLLRRALHRLRSPFRLVRRALRTA